MSRDPEFARDDYEILMRNTLQILAFCVAVLLAGCGAPSREFSFSPIAAGGKGEDDAFEDLNTIVFSDGVDAREAAMLACSYFQHVYGGCGGCSSAEDRGTNWCFRCAVGFAGADRPGITVSKSNCWITCASGPEITNLVQMLSFKDPIWDRTKWHKYQSSN